MTHIVKEITETVDFLLDEKQCPVARMRLLSDGINLNNRLLLPLKVTGDRGCLACGNCVDACPVVREEYRFVYLQNERTSMALEFMVGEECRRCYRCILACPQVTKSIKEYASTFRRGEKIIHFMAATLVILLAATGITLTHYTNILPEMEVRLLGLIHKGLGVSLLIMPVLYLILDKRHFLRFLRKIVLWNKNDWEWLKALLHHIGNSKKYAMPDRAQFNPGQKAWYLYIVCVMFPILSISGIIQWIGLDYGLIKGSTLTSVVVIHMIFAFVTDVLLFVHIYIKYIRNWAIFVFDIFKSLIKFGHLNYSKLYKP